MSFPGLYPDENKIIPYSPRKRFGFVSGADKIIELESMKNMSIDQIIEMYKEGYIIENTNENTNQLYMSDKSPTIATAQGIFISSGAILLIGIGVLAYLYFKHR